MRDNREEWFRDIVGNPLEVDNCVLVCQNNRIVVGRITELHDTWVMVRPLEAEAGKRREAPPQKVLRKYPYNVYAVNPKEIFWAQLKDSL